MRVRSHEKLPLRALFIVLLCLFPVTFMCIFLIGVSNIYRTSVAWSYDIDPPDEADLWVANHSRNGLAAQVCQARAGGTQQQILYLFR